MNVAVIGSGGREHALAKALVKSPKVKSVHCIPGSDGLKNFFTCHQLDIKNQSELLQCLRSNEIEFVIIGPEVPLVEGLADFLRSEDFKVFGPNKDGARLEGSKNFSKEFMKKARIPTAQFKIAKSYNEALMAADSFSFPLVIKADVLAAGKGVMICKSRNECLIALDKIFKKESFGPSEVLIEEFISGWEISYIIITDGEKYEVCPLAQDHKTLKEGGKGPNTGGMGVFGPLEIEEQLDQKIRNRIVEPSLKALKEQGIDFKGALFIGIMVKNNEPFVLEYNVRFGDPETQIIMPLIDGDIFELLYSAACGDLKPLKVKKNIYAACVVLAAENYPEKPVKGTLIENLDLEETEDSYFLFAGVKFEAEQYFVNGGRVLGALGLGSTKQEAIEKAYSQSEKAHWKGLQKRNDIGSFFEN